VYYLTKCAAQIEGYIILRGKIMLQAAKDLVVHKFQEM